MQNEKEITKQHLRILVSNHKFVYLFKKDAQFPGKPNSNFKGEMNYGCHYRFERIIQQGKGSF